MKTYEIIAGLQRQHSNTNRSGQTATDAALRRMDPAQPGSAAIVAFRALAGVGLDLERQSPERLSGWLLIVHLMALSRWRHNHRISIGQALSAIRLGDTRLKQLLSADYETLQQLLPRLTRRLASHPDFSGMNFVPLARLILAAGGGTRDLEPARLDIALSYTRSEQKASTEKRKAS